MFRLIPVFLLCSGAVGFIVPHTSREAGTTYEEFVVLAEAFQEWHYEIAPHYAEYFNLHRARDRLESYQYEEYEQRIKICRGYIDSLYRIPRADLTSEQQISYDLLEATIQMYIDGAQFINYGNLNPMNQLETYNLYTNELKIKMYDDAGDQLQEYWDRIARNYGLRNLIRQQISLMRRAIVVKRTYHVNTIIRMLIEMRETMSPLFDLPAENVWENFTDIVKDIEIIEMDKNLGSETKLKLVSELKWQVGNAIVPAYAELVTFLDTEYRPYCRKSSGVYDWEGSAEFYTAAVRYYTTLRDVTPPEIHNTGLENVARMKVLMEALIERDQPGSGYNISSYAEFLREATKGMNEAELLQGYRDICDNVTKKLDLIFYKEDQARDNLTVVPLGYDGPGGMYGNNIFYVNTMDAEERPTYDMLDLSLHEGVPGHHLQQNMASYLSLMPFRTPEGGKRFAVPLHFAYYTAYVEGWALYSESLGEELQVIRNEADRFGIYAGEMFRATRLVVDTGLHYMNWTHERAVDYMIENTGDIRRDVEQEVDRYMSWPGQATGYLMGQIVIRKLRTEAEMHLGADFNVKDFHHEVLKNGEVTMSILEREIRAWYRGDEVQETTTQAGNGLTARLFIFLFILTQ